MELQPIFIQLLALALFAIGIMVAISRRNLFFVLMGIELALNAVNLSFVGFAKTLPDTMSVAGQIIPLFSIVIFIFRNRESIDADTYSDMRG